MFGAKAGTEKSYINWIKRYILFHNKRHPREMAGKEIEEFLTPQSGKRKGVCERSQRLMRQHKRGNMSPD